jgi:light-regulated signal transduction histidine kinase (bacteriophytochrome)
MEKWLREAAETVSDELRSSNRELKDFVVLVSHDLKAIRRGMSLLDNSTSKDRPDVSDEEIRAQTSLLAERINRLDDLVTLVAKYITIGEAHEPDTAVALDEAVEDVVTELAVPSHVTILTEGLLPVIRCRRTAVTEVLSCLVKSALRQIDQVQGVIRVRCEEEGQFWKLTVSDSGPGIAPQGGQGVFRLFQATPNSHWEDFGTTLAMAKRSVEACGGRIWVEAGAGRGTHVHFTVPKVASGEPILTK